MNVSLLEYLQVGPPLLPIAPNPGYSKENTKNAKYNARDITSVGYWSIFNLATITAQITAQYGNILAGATLPSEPMPASPPQVLTSETSFRNRFTLYLDSRIRRSLRAGFQWLLSQNSIDGNSVSMAVIKTGKSSDRPWHCELVAIRRLDGNGNLELSDSIPWETHGSATHPVLTVALALWYIGMLASDNRNWFLP
ncbi:hypothetical protein C8Q69DRAFT_500646 [Paecilomyces variotii]|uniref:Uncharacterized protein n=1 Tax=Byssochlamys spectabilis TaxID=264951 RepID=A0A443HNP8_BYSSP|nr:hypothetical protein C8Q69DRAFT_500646 [Paecilomyces variotii]RWQ93429.1 hypothetical protein C8Q69DRAFT_500646 [Paecilomyces variotii]